jgi:YidC/Oxa1 family membrane protein insertase
MLAQAPVFIGLYHVLNSFNRTQTGFGRLGLTVQENASLGNYFFSAEDVRNFLDAHLFGAPLGASMIQTVGLGAFKEFNRPSVIAVGVPLMIIAGIATHFNSRASVARQSPEAAAAPQTAMMNRLALYFFPLFVVIGGPFLPIAIIMYWVSNNIWTYGQQHYVFGQIEAREEAKKKDELERRASNAPAPGAKPRKAKSGGARKPAAKVDDATDDAVDAADESESKFVAESKLVDDVPQTGTELGSKNVGTRNGAQKNAPRRTNRPKKRRP